MIENDDAPETDADESLSATEGPALRAVVTEYGDHPDECTLYPTDATEAELVTTWITAEGDAFVDLEAVR
ncbi:MAG: hypothetical protein ABEJ74_08845 [Haloferacaceae archaeon]